MPWKIIFRTSSGKGNLTISRYLKFEDGYLVIQDNEDRALIALTRPNRGVDFDIYHVEGTLPGPVREALSEFKPGRMSQSPDLPKAGVEMDTAVRATAPEVPGLDVVADQPDMPDKEAVLLPSEYGGPEVDVHIPEVSVEGDPGLLLLDRTDLEVKATELGIEDPADYRNDDLLIAAIMEAEAGTGEGESPETEEESTLKTLAGLNRAELVEMLGDAGHTLEDVLASEGTMSNNDIRSFIARPEEETADAEPEGSEVESILGGEGSGGDADPASAD